MEKTFASMRQLDHHDQSPIRIYPNHEADDYPPHWHRQCEIIMPVVEGYSAVVDNVTYDILPGEVFLIPPGVVHELFAPETGQRYIFMLDQEELNAIDGIDHIQHCFYPCLHLRMDREADMLESAKECLWQAVREHEGRDLMAQSAVLAWIHLFLIRLGRWLLLRKEENQGEHRHQMNEAFLDVYAYIAAHCSEKITLEDIAAYSGYSKYHFVRIFKEYSGMSFYEFYMQQRMMLCRQLLAEVDVPVTEVALRSGFGSIATFNRVFKQHEGVTPTQYRKLKQSARKAQIYSAQDANQEKEPEAQR
ncbi:MAG: AraC family transcriptional regulator [Clostridia bacterium]|nr:AraC family transcriptional regulator [Clostridia bacterium]